MNANVSYVLVTPVRDEAATIRRTIKAVLEQTVLPREWVIVSDGSRDGTDELVLDAATKHPWIRLLPLAERPGRCFAAVVHNTQAGIRHLEFRDYHYVGLLDADVTFQRDYFEQLVCRFQAYPTLGLAGGVVIDVGLPRDRFPVNRFDVPGAVQFFRRSCLERIGGLTPLAEGGWDSLTCAAARMQGFQTRLFTDLVVDHLKPRNISEGGVIRRKWQMGVRDCALGYHPAFEALKCANRLKDPPFIVGAVAWWIGFATAYMRNRPRIIDPQMVAYIRHEQGCRIRRLLCPWKNRRPADGIESPRIP